MVENGYEPSLSLYISVSHGLCKEGKVQEAERLFGKGCLDEGMWTMLIDVLLEDGETKRCLKQLKAMEENGFEPNVKTYTALIRELCKENKNFEE